MSPRALRIVAWASLLVLGLAAPFLVYPVFAMNVLCLALFASAFNLLLGYTGLLSFGHAASLGSAAYVTGYTVRSWGFPPELGVAAGTAVATLLGAIFGSLAIRRSGIYFAMITLGFAQLVYFLVVQMPWTGGEDGLQGIPRGKAFFEAAVRQRFPRARVARMDRDTTRHWQEAQRILEERRLKPFRNSGELSRIAGADTISQRLAGKVSVKGSLFRITSVARVKETVRTVEVVVRLAGHGDGGTGVKKETLTLDVSGLPGYAGRRIPCWSAPSVRKTIILSAVW